MTPVYEGPLDLLLALIEKAELDITRLALAEVTDQFLKYLAQIPENSAADVSAFIVIASKLIQIKSEVLLPRPPTREPGEIDPGEALAQQLIIYRRFKIIADLLMERQMRLRTFPRLAPVPKYEISADLVGLSIEDLLLVAQYLFNRRLDLPTLDSVVSAQKITIRQKILQIADFLRQNQRGAFRDLFTTQAHPLEVVITFLALLELVKRQLVSARQEDLFSEITFESLSVWDEDLNFELEFGE